MGIILEIVSETNSNIIRNLSNNLFIRIQEDLLILYQVIFLHPLDIWGLSSNNTSQTNDC